MPMQLQVSLPTCEPTAPFRQPQEQRSLTE